MVLEQRETALLFSCSFIYLAAPWLAGNIYKTGLIYLALRFITLAAGLRALVALNNLIALSQGIDLSSREHVRETFNLCLVYAAAMFLMSLGGFALVF